ncbi:MAG: GAF domain-containing protein [Chloroflexi bacterium]|nr:GAF domain-containing protein [Chloroflexota bacterium]
MPNRLRRLLAPPIFENEEKTRVSQFMINFSWIAIGIILLLVISRFALRTDATIIPALTLLSIILLLLIMQDLVKRGRVYAGSIVVIFGLWGTMTYLAWRADGLRDAAIIAYFVIIIFCSLLTGWRTTSVVTVMTIISIWVFAILEKQGIRISHVDDPISFAGDLTGILILVWALIYMLISGWSKSLRSARLELMERLRVEEKLQSQAVYLNALNETALGLLNRFELRPLLESILIQSCGLIDTDHGLIEMVLPDGSALRQELGCGVLAKYDGAITLRDEGVTGTVWNSGKYLVVDDYRAWDKRLPDFIDAGICAVLAVPLIVRETVIGVLAVSYIEEKRNFTQEQVNFMERFASLAALAIDNVQLYEQAQQEIRERSTVEAALRLSEDKFRKVFNNSNIAVAIATLEDGTFLEANAAFWELSGLRPELAIGHNTVELNMWEGPRSRKEFVQELLEKRSLQNVKVGFPNKISLGFYELIQIEEQTCILCMFYDITEQQEMENALKTSDARTRAILASIPDMIFEISKDGTFLDLLASSEISPTMPPSQFIGKNLKELFPPTIARQSIFALDRAIATQQIHAFEYGLPPGEEVQFFEARVAAISSESAMIMVREISQRKWIESEREKLIRELEDINAELERFTYTVSHDLKSPLITIKGFLGFLEQDAASGNMVRLKSDVKRIGDATDKMQLLLNELLELSRVGRLTNPSQTINFKELAREMVDLLYGRLHQREIQVHIQSNLPPVFGDRQRLNEALQNLIDNAAKFMGDQPNPRIEIGQSGFENNMPIFFVKDNGVGIDPIHQERIFGFFNKLDAKSEGTGIGLTLVKRIIEIHGGRIWVESEMGKGAAFFFTLPTGPKS